ncbi:MAG: MBL fold metallo-hydrolase [Candidatus Helarchaeota archaeon]|nr:MBL fold metallo-hydrolase [Candidatus Helarchaeota archaeon]
MKLTWLGTAGFEVKFDNITILLDPWISRPPEADPKIPLNPVDLTKADYIFLTHGHFDHSADVGTIAKQTGAKIICSKKASEIFLREEVPEDQIQIVTAGDELDFETFKVKVIRSKHISFGLTTILWKFFSWKVLKSARRLLRDGRGHPKGEVFGFYFQLKKEALTFCHFGSGGYYKEELEKFRPDLFLAPVAGRRNILEVIAQMTKFLNPKMVIGHHWDDFYPPLSWRVPIEEFELEVKKLLPDIVVKIPVPLEEMEIQSIT